MPSSNLGMESDSSFLVYVYYYTLMDDTHLLRSIFPMLGCELHDYDFPKTKMV